MARHHCPALLALLGGLRATAPSLPTGRGTSMMSGRLPRMRHPRGGWAQQECLPSGRSGGAAFALPAAVGGQDGHLGKHGLVATRAAPSSTGPSSGPFSTMAGGSIAASAFAALALLQQAARSKVVRRARGIREEKHYTYERKWWSVEETRDPTTLPIWQRDFRYGFQVLKRTMVEQRKKGNKVFWDCRVIESKDEGCRIEMLNSGLLGWCPISQEGADGARLAVGDVVRMECTACPQKRVNSEKKNSPWPQEKRRFRAEPLFSHWNWIEQQNSIEKAKELKSGEIVEGTVFKHIGKGVIVTLEGKNAPKGMLAMMDISRKTSARSWVTKMFPPGTKIKCYVVHADTQNGRITLSTKEFEDDDHVGWMLSFPERCFKRAEEAVARYHEKRQRYIEMLQR
eukprot:CAMPEP_0175230180 /NCGR_PEP_ID=MMETSP0093-20121207/24814_1 /TAXON_ID=311494 /ORGANISM="Alexandrium monilatum, Strain CCMP3105" /LENGTH=398 /DNA_ID=CAMNT_0016524005 /DNA_START=79 /DNA_END=1275 /DNA_ORIENTATION=-